MADILIPMFLFFLNDTATTEIYTLSLHDALPISAGLVLVAARENSGEESLPGALPGVIAVGLDWDCPRDTYRCTIANSEPLFFASGYPRSIPGIPVERNLNGISFAVANMTGFAARA